MGRKNKGGLNISSFPENQKRRHPHGPGHRGHRGHRRVDGCCWEQEVNPPEGNCPGHWSKARKDKHLWRKHLRERVTFAPAVHLLIKVFNEVSP